MEDKYSDADHIYQILVDYVIGDLETDSEFSKRIYKYLINGGSVTGKELCLALYSQNILAYDEAEVRMLEADVYKRQDEANIGICDRIFTRVGASDDLASGQSTFMVEMTEVANILRNATKNKMCIRDRYSIYRGNGAVRKKDPGL